MLYVATACSDLSAPARTDRYEWRMLFDYDSLGPREDTLSFHWPQSRLPVKIWAENAQGLPGNVTHGIGLWRAAFLYGEWDAKLVADSQDADIIVRSTLTPPPLASPILSRLRSRLLPQCEGATDIDTVATRFQLRLPIRMYLHRVLADDPNLARCLTLTTAHEIGHSLGIFQHSPDSDDLMYAFPAVDGPTPRDQNTAQSAYHVPATMVPVRE